MRLKIMLILCSLVVIHNCSEIDPNGYIAFCPCMGRFGNQADHYLGAIGFAKAINRTLILPPWVEYRMGQPKSIQVPFEEYFDVRQVEKFHRVITMENFMSQLAPEVWPIDRRISFCYAYRPGKSPNSCNSKDGNPFGSFWDTYDIDFIGSETYGPLHFDVRREEASKQWIEMFPSEDWPVLAFTGAPASFPVQKENVPIQKYLVWNDKMLAKAEHFISDHLSPGRFIGVHFRNGGDWKRACDLVASSPNLFSSPQCLGYQNEFGSLTEEMCQPSEEVIVKHLRKKIKEFQPKFIFVASDHDHMIHTLSKYFDTNDLPLVKLDRDDSHLDLVILGQADHFIGNCVSSFSAFVKRERNLKGLSSSFWGFPSERSRHQEL